MSIKVDTLEEVGDVMMNVFGNYKKQVLDQLFDNLMETTPERTGTLKYNWRFKPGGNAGSFLQENDGTARPFPRSPKDVTYTRNWSQFTIYNNSPYIIKVNNGEGGNEQNQNFIQQALEMTNARI